MSNVQDGQYEEQIHTLKMENETLRERLEAANRRIEELKQQSHARFISAGKHFKAREAAEAKLATAQANEKVYRDALDYCSAPGAIHDTVDGLKLVIERQAKRAIEALQRKALAQIDAPEGLERSDKKAEQREVDAYNLRFYAEMFKQHQWSTVVIHWSVFEQTLREMADRIEGQQPQSAQPSEEGRA